MPGEEAGSESDRRRYAQRRTGKVPVVQILTQLWRNMDSDSVSTHPAAAFPARGREAQDNHRDSLDQLTSITPLVVAREHHNISRANISENALKVLYRLRQGGYEA